MHLHGCVCVRVGRGHYVLCKKLDEHQSQIECYLGASIVKWTKKVLRYTEAMIFLVKRL